VTQVMYQRELAFTYRNYSFLELLNVGGSSISRLRVLLPYRLIDLDELKSLRNLEDVGPLRKKQASYLKLRSQELASPSHKSNWIYRTVSHVDIDTAKVMLADLQSFGGSLLKAIN